MYFQQQRLDMQGKSILLKAIHNRALHVAPERNAIHMDPPLGKGIANWSTESYSDKEIERAFDDEGEVHDVLKMLYKVGVGTEETEINAITYSLVKYLLDGFFHPTLSNAFKIKSYRCRVEAMTVALSYWFGLDIVRLYDGGKSLDIIENAAMEALDQVCRDGIDFGNAEAVREATGSEYFSELAYEGWHEYKTAYARGYVKVNDSGRIIELHCRGPLKGMLSTQDHYSGSTYYYLKHHYRFDPFREARRLIALQGESPRVGSGFILTQNEAMIESAATADSIIRNYLRP